MAPCGIQEVVHRRRINRHVAGATALTNERREFRFGYRTQWERPRGTIQRLVAVGEDPLHEMLATPEKNVRDIRLHLKYGAHQRRQMLVDLNYLLKLVQDEN